MTAFASIWVLTTAGVIVEVGPTGLLEIDPSGGVSDLSVELELGNYLECKGGAIVLADEEHIWVLGHKGLRTSVLHSDTFLSICHRSMKGKESFSVSKRQRSVAQQHYEVEPRDAFHFFSAAPILLNGRHHPQPIGCIIALDTRPRGDSSAWKVQKTLENLAQMVMNLLVEEKTILRIYTSRDFRIFVSNGLDLALSESHGVIIAKRRRLFLCVGATDSIEELRFG